MIENESTYLTKKKVKMREERQQKKCQGEILALLCVWSIDLQACSGVSV